MRREVGIPLLLWAAAAAWIHTMFGGGGYAVARLHDDQNDVLAFSGRVREKVKQSEQVISVDWDEGNGDTQDAPGEAPLPPDAQKVQKKDDAQKDAVSVPEPPKAKPPEPKPPIPILPAKEQPKPPPPPPPEMLQQEKRIAVKQHAKPNQEDNPNAKHIAEDANHVEKESVATQTSHDQDDPNPTPAGQHAGAAGSVGNGEKTRIADSTEHKGEKNKAPGDRGTEFDIQKEPAARPLTALSLPKLRSDLPKSGGDGRPAGAAAQAPRAAQNPESSSSPEVQSGPGGWSFKAFQPGSGAEARATDSGSTGQSAKGAEKASKTQWLGLGGKPGPGQINLNLSHDGVVASVGEQQLHKERVNDGERRLSQHRGSWQGSSLERWRSAIENYVATVKPGNQTSLNAARVPFATYLLAIHLRIHPIFADTFLDSIENLPPTHPLSDKKLMTRLEIILSPKDGSITRMGVARPSGVTAFDLAALDAVQRASPFGPAPGAIVSTDGKVYLHWEFHRDESACTTANARPYMLNLPPAPGPGPEYPDTPKHPTPSEGVPGRDSRQGSLFPGGLFPSLGATLAGKGS